MLRYSRFKTVGFCVNLSTAASKNQKTSKTVLLPKTKFPLRLERQKLVDRDRILSTSPQFLKLYDWQMKNLKEPAFVLHDGPPYANGAPHMGHAMNKILKDVIIRSKILKRQKVHFVPGWDCHGLPIELKATGAADNKVTPLEIRRKARRFAKKTIEEQKFAFMSWGVIGNWGNSYTTYSTSYIKNQMKQFYELYDKKLVYRDVKPVYWSPSSKTALAESELEYNPEHKSVAVTLKLKLDGVPSVISKYENRAIYALIWTTTPWTLPSNQGICYNPELSYSIVQNDENFEYYVIATNLLESTSNVIKSKLKLVGTFAGSDLQSATYIHPIYPISKLPFVPSSHATEDKGTGLVHLAPAHGPEDYIVALANKIPVKCMVDEAGEYTPEAGSKLQGLNVLSDGTKAVLDIVQEKIIDKADYVHSYPYDWRTKQPVILRASKQWFIDTSAIKTTASRLLEAIRIIPKSKNDTYKQHFINQIQKRPYWCISRQRSWGVPIPVFYKKSTDTPIFNNDILNHLCKLMDKHGSDYWWSLPTDKLIPDEFLNGLKADDIVKGQDILDIWFDSGVSWSNALPGDQVADMYLEGADQFTGWFQSSLLTSVALRNKSPYKSIYVHGFAVDENGLKMSKSIGNVVDPQVVMEGSDAKKAYGVDTLRWWVAYHASQDSLSHISNNVLQSSSDEVQKIRNVLRFALSGLNDYTSKSIDYHSLKIIDKYMLFLLRNFQKQASEHLEDYQYNKLCKLIINFLTNSVSTLYYTAVKDRLYCDEGHSINRTSAQYILEHIFHIVTRHVAPILPHLAEELYLHLPHKKCDSFFQTELIQIPNYSDFPQVDNLMDQILTIKKDIHKVAGTSTLEKSINIFASLLLFKRLQVKSIDALCLELRDVFQVAEVHIIETGALNNFEYVVDVEKTNLKHCVRCRKFASRNDELCDRCTLVVKDYDEQVSSLS